MSSETTALLSRLTSTWQTAAFLALSRSSFLTSLVSDCTCQSTQIASRHYRTEFSLGELFGVGPELGTMVEID